MHQPLHMLVILSIFLCISCSGSPPNTKVSSVNINSLPVPSQTIADNAPSNQDCLFAQDDANPGPIPVGHNDPMWGCNDAPVTIVEFSDLQCPFCARASKTIQQLQDTYGPSKIRIAWKHFPLSFHKDAANAAIASMLLFEHGGPRAFWAFHDFIFENQKDLSDDMLINLLRKQSKDESLVKKFDALEEENPYFTKLDDDIALGKDLGVSGTPAFFINGIFLSGAQPLDKFRELIDAQLKAAETFIQNGSSGHAASLQLTKTNFTSTPNQDAKKKTTASDDSTTVWHVPVVSSPIRGNADALVTLVEFSDFQCSFCKRVESIIERIFQEYDPKEVRLVWKDNPLPFHKDAFPAAMMAQEARAQKGKDGFWKAHHALFENQQDLSTPTLVGIAKTLGLNETKVKQAIEKNKYEDLVLQDQDLADSLNANGTPHFFINGRRLSGAQPFEKFKTIIDEEIVKAKSLISSGVKPAKVYDEIMKSAREPAPPQMVLKPVSMPTSKNPSKGNKNAKVILQVFSDFQCPFCGKLEPTLAEIEKSYGSKIKIVWRNYPLPFHNHAMLAAQAAQEVFQQKGDKAFWKYHDLLFENQKDLSREDLEKYATQIGGIDIKKFNAALDSETHRSQVESDIEAGKNAGVSGTPAVLINNYFISGAQPIRKFRKIINLALGPSKK